MNIVKASSIIKLLPITATLFLTACDRESPPNQEQIKSGLEHLYISSKVDPQGKYEYGATDIISVDILGNGCEKPADYFAWKCDIAINYVNFQGKLVKRITKMEFFYNKNGKVVPAILDALQIFNLEDSIIKKN